MLHFTERGFQVPFIHPCIANAERQPASLFTQAIQDCIGCLDEHDSAPVGYEAAFMARCQELIYKNEKALASSPSR